MKGSSEDAFMADAEAAFRRLHGKPQPIPVYPSHPPVFSPPPSSNWRVGVGEETRSIHLATIRKTWDQASLQQLRRELPTEYPQRRDLMAAVDRQLIRCEL